MVSINFTLFVQLANFLILLVVLNFLLFKPILRVLDEREKLVKDAAEIKERLSGLADENIARYESQLLSAKQESMSIRTASRSEALGEFRKILQDTKEENAKELDIARKTLAAQAEESRTVLKTEAENLADKVAAKLLGHNMGGRA
ncbi:MAG: ATP synthase F0 subunit B [Deltaproteobacteria bacterium]|nr:ATP synthase F0 subunit B [Deltaproteobacteria bacterium]